MVRATVVVVGANRGIGLALVEAYLERGDAVLATCRSSNPQLDATGAEVVTGVDVTTEQGLDRLEEALEGRLVDVLIHNAGILTKETLSDLNVDRILRQFEVNALAPLRTVARMSRAMRPGSKVGILTSRMGSIADNGSGSMYGYRMSKAAVNAAGVSLARDLAPAGIAVALLHPGFVRTDMTGGNGYVDAAHAASGLVARLHALTLDVSGRFWHADGQELPW
jgi:NAD(P)-dependent dehydrogenase (short-subunit alcohol dehydrogenase family)